MTGVQTCALPIWANDVKSFVLNRAVNESIIPQGYKLSTTRTNRKIEDQALAAHILIDKGFKTSDIYEPQSLKSIAQLEKLGAKGQVANILGSLIVRPEGSPKLVKDDSASEDFK